MMPRDKDIMENLIKIEPATNRQSPFFLLGPIYYVRDYFTINEFVVIADILYFLVCVVIVIMLLRRRGRLRGIVIGLGKVMLLLLVVAVLMLGWKVYNEEIVERAVVVRENAIARSGPGEQFMEVLELPAGTKVRILREEEGNWVRFTLRDGRSGYLPEGACERI
jgi:hypothetical protein